MSSVFCSCLSLPVSSVHTISLALLSHSHSTCARSEAMFLQMKIAVAALSKEWLRGRSHDGMRVRILSGAWMSVSCECCVFSCRGLYDGPIFRSGSLTECVFMSLSVIRCSSNPQHLQKLFFSSATTCLLWTSWSSLLDMGGK